MAAEFRDTQGVDGSRAGMGPTAGTTTTGTTPDGHPFVSAGSGTGGGIRAVPDLLAALLRETSELLRTEGRLVRAELSDKLGQMQVGAGSIAAGAICLLVSLFVLSQALIVALSNYVDAAWAALGVGILFAAIGVILLLKGKKDLEPSSLAPDRTARQLRKDTELVKEQAR